MEFESSLVSSVSLRGDYFRNCCKPKLNHTKWLISKGTILVLTWNFLVISVYHYFVISKARDPIKKKIQLSPGEILAIGLLLPVGGWLADAYFGRYKVILYSMWTIWFGAMLNGLSLVIGKVNTPYEKYGDPWVSVFCKVIMGAGMGAFQANIIQFGIDQLSEASSTEIKSFIVWYTMTISSSGVTMQFSGYCSQEYVVVLVVALYLTLALCSNFVLNHWLVKDQVIDNPLPLIWKTVQYTIVNRQQWRRIFTLDQHGVLSRLNVAKTIYAGPFTSEQVENVKTFFRVMAAIAVVMTTCSGIPITSSVLGTLEIHLQNWPNNTNLRGCYKGESISYSHYIFLVVVVPLYQVIVYPLFHNCIPKVSITTKFLFSTLLFFAGVMSLVGIESASYHYQVGMNQTTIKCVFQNENIHANVKLYWTIIPRILIGLSAFILILSGIEFICAQAPFNMKGLMFGMVYGLYGLSSLVHSALAIPFLSKKPLWEKAPLTCGVWFFVIQGVIVLSGLVVVVVMIKRYKRRNRINITSQSDWLQDDVQINTVN